MNTFLAFSVLLFSLGFSQAFGSVGSHSQGYVSDVAGEKAERFYEVYLFVPNPKSRTLQDIIFSPLTQEFKIRYLEKFGSVDTESIVYRSGNFSEFDQNYHQAVGVESENSKRKEFAEYMMKRLTEYHFDNYLKTEPQLRPLMEVKQKVQNIKVEVSKEIRLNIQYNFAGNNLDLIADNPWCDSKLGIEMDPHSFVPTSPREMRLWLGKDLNRQLRLSSQLAMTDGIAGAELGRSISRWHILTTVGLTSPFKGGGTSVRETKYLVGFSHAY